MGISNKTLQALAAHHTTDEAVANRLAGCGRRAVAATVTTTVGSNGNTGTRGVMSCDLRHLCAYCGTKEMEDQAVLLEASISAWQALGLTVLLVTFTVPHSLRDRLASTVQWLAAGEKAVLQGSARARIERLYGVGPYFRRREFDRLPENGWHPHSHVLLFVERTLTDAEVAALREDMSARFLRAVRRAGAPESLGDQVHAVDARAVDAGDAHVVARYITKTTAWNGEPKGSFALLAALAEHRTADGSPCDCARCLANTEAWSEFVAWTQETKRQRFAAPVGLEERLAALGSDAPARQVYRTQDTARLRKTGWEFLEALGVHTQASPVAADGGWRVLRSWVCALLTDHGLSETDAARQAAHWVLPPTSTEWRTTARRRGHRYTPRLGSRRCP